MVERVPTVLRNWDKLGTPVPAHLDLPAQTAQLKSPPVYLIRVQVAEHAWWMALKRGATSVNVPWASWERTAPKVSTDQSCSVACSICNVLFMWHKSGVGVSYSPRTSPPAFVACSTIIGGGDQGPKLVLFLALH